MTRKSDRCSLCSYNQCGESKERKYVKLFVTLAQIRNTGISHNMLFFLLCFYFGYLLATKGIMSHLNSITKTN